MAASLADIENLISSDIATVAQRLSVAIDDIEHHSTATPKDRETAESLRAVVQSVDYLRSIPIEFIPAVATIVASVERGDIEAAEHEIELVDNRPVISSPTVSALEVVSEALDTDEAIRKTEMGPEI